VWDREGRACETCRLTVSADTGISEGSGGRAWSSPGCIKGWLWERERNMEALREREGAAEGAAGAEWSYEKGQ
jgi:hypothetical protein